MVSLIKNKQIIVTGGYGFIGSNLIKKLIKFKNINVINIDKETYASNKRNIDYQSDNLVNIKADISNKKRIMDIFNFYQPEIIFNLAAETHVDQSIYSPYKFLKSNVEGVFNLLCCCRELNLDKNKNFKFIQISTDEVYGSLKKGQKKFSESSQYKPNSPYSASKASSDHLCRAWYKTYNFPVIITNCSNNYGPFQNNEKLIPKIIDNALKNKKIPIYGDGMQIRDWIFVDDHILALIQISKRGRLGEKYNIGGNNEITNIALTKLILKEISKLTKHRYENLIEFVKDRPGHDFRYAINNSKIKSEIKWENKTNLKKGIVRTVEWYFQKNR